jgi:hypothetical protein
MDLLSLVGTFFFSFCQWLTWQQDGCTCIHLVRKWKSFLLLPSSQTKGGEHMLHFLYIVLQTNCIDKSFEFVALHKKCCFCAS